MEQTNTPLPAARPSAFTTSGTILPLVGKAIDDKADGAFGIAERRGIRPSATSAVCSRFLQKTLLPSSWAAPLEGPKTRSFSVWKASTMPATSGASGPTMVRSTTFCLANRMSAGDILGRNIDIHRISRCPSVSRGDEDGAARGLWRSFHARACSRPPLPTIRIFNLAMTRI